MCLLSDFQNNVIMHRYKVNKLPIINPVIAPIIISVLLYIFISPFTIKYKFYVVFNKNNLQDYIIFFGTKSNLLHYLF